MDHFRSPITDDDGKMRFVGLASHVRATRARQPGLSRFFVSYNESTLPYGTVFPGGSNSSSIRTERNTIYA